MRKKNTKRTLCNVSIGVILIAGIGYFAPSLWLKETDVNDKETFIRQFVNKMPKRNQDFIFPEYDTFLEKKVTELFAPVIGKENIRVVVHADLDIQKKKVTTEKFLPDTGVIIQQNTQTTTDNNTVTNTTYAYSSETTTTSFTVNDVKQTNALVFVSHVEDKIRSNFFQEQKNVLFETAQSIIGYSKERGDSFQIIEFPKSLSFAKEPLFTTQIKQVIAILLICVFCMVGLLAVILPYFFNRRKKLLKLSLMPFSEDENLYQNQIIGKPEETLLTRIRQLCMEMPEVAVNLIRRQFAQNDKSNIIENDSFSPVQHAGIVLLCLGDRCVKTLFKRMTDSEIKALSKIMVGLGRVKAIEIQPILLRFFQEMQTPQDIISTDKQTIGLIKNALPIERASYILQSLNIHAHGKSVWQKLNKLSSDSISEYLQSEYPQTVAEILYHLSTKKSAQVLMCFKPDFATEVIVRLSALNYITPMRKFALENQLNEQIDMIAQKQIIQGEQKAAAILSLVDTAICKDLLIRMAKNTPQTADNLEKQLITFNDFAFWNETDLAVLIKHIDTKTLITALAHANNTTKEAFSKVIDPQKWANLLKQINTPQTKRLKDIEESQRAVIQIAQYLIDSQKCKGKLV